LRVGFLTHAPGEQGRSMDGGRDSRFHGPADSRTGRWRESLCSSRSGNRRGFVRRHAIRRHLLRHHLQAEPAHLHWLYGVTSGGGYDAHGLSAGVVFDITPPSSGGGYWGETVTHDFGAQPIDGDSPYDGLVIAQSGVLYGTTYYGGNGTGCGNTSGCGTVFEMTPSSGGGWTESVLYNFGITATDGAYPYFGTLLLGNNGTLYGTTSAGGLSGFGEIFALAPPTPPASAWTKMSLYSFTGTAGDGASPYNGLIAGPNGTFFGTTFAGGSHTGTCPAGCGTVFELTQ
jgi:uncharacterized repeat protein (TIGR03803 family)